MLIKYYSPSKHKSLNNDNIENKSLTTNVFKGIKYPTKPIEDVFSVFKTSDILHLIEEQQKYIKKEADIFLKYNWISGKAYEMTLDQYNNLYYYEDNFYKITDLKLYITKQNNQYNTYIETKNKEKELNPKQTAKISRQAIRNLTGYSPYFTPTEWDGEEAYVKRQDDLIKDETDLILVLGSRQIGKTKMASERVKLASGEYKICKDLEETDILLGSDYQPIKITQLIKNQKKPSYKIIFDNGHQEIYSSEHRIPLDKNFNPKNKWDKNKITQSENYFTIEDLFNIQEDNIALKYKVPFIFNTPEQNNEDLTYEEALLYGYFLGNGCNSNNQIVGKHSRLLKLSEFKISENIHKNIFSYGIFGYKQKVKLKGLGLSKDKFIDQKIFKQKKYLQWAVLDGLLNTDGYISVMSNNSPVIEYCSVSQQLIDDIFLLGLELGLVFKKRTKKIKSNFRTDNEFAYYLDIQEISTLKKIIENTNLQDKLNYNSFKDAIYNQINSTHRCSRIGTIPLSSKEYITNSSRKNKKPWYNFQREKIENGTFEGINDYLKYSWHGIKKIEYVGEQEVVSIGVDSDDELFFTGGSLTHNSLTLSEKAIEESHLPNNTILVGAFTTSSTNTIRNYLRRFIRKFPEGYWEENKSERFIQNMKTGSKIFFRTLADDAVDAIRGMTLNTILVDEAQLVSEYAYLDVLEPTLATTGGKMILIGTPPKIPDGFFVEQIFKYKKGELDNASFYEIKLPDQPFTHPKVREKKMNMMDDPRTQREWFCNLTTDIDVLFTPKLAKEFPELVKDKSTFYVIGIDPARKKDRSGYCVIQVKEGIATSIESGFIPDTFKKDWKLQAIFLKRLKSKYDNYGDIITVIDSSGVGDGVLSIFREHGLNIKYTVRYTSGQTKMLKNTDYTVGKHVLINNVLDLITEQLVEVVDITNRQMIEEMKYIYEVEFKSGLIGFKTKFYDDITNAFMIALFIISEKNLISRSLINPGETIQSTGASVVDAIERRLPQGKTSQAW